jgi:hypothetical protein
MEGEKLSGGDSTCCGVELKYRARLGRRNVGGSAEDGIRVSRTDRRTLLLSIVRVDICVGLSNCWRCEKLRLSELSDLDILLDD